MARLFYPAALAGEAHRAVGRVVHDRPDTR